MTPRLTHQARFLFLFLVFFLLCAPYPVYKATPANKRTTPVKHPRNGAAPQRQHGMATQAQASPTRDTGRESDDVGPPPLPSSGVSDTPPAPAASDSMPVRPLISGRLIRVALGQNLKQANLSSAGRVEIRSGNAESMSAQGSLSAGMSSTGRAVMNIPGRGRAEIALPCTLWSTNEFNIVQFNAASYRGSMIIASERRGFFSVINYCDVEDYLRGVVPLELGNCGKQDMEAIKAQAVAARTYTYKKIQDSKNQAFDLMPDISDQVYGGVNAEKTVCNQAIRETRGLVLVDPSAGQGDSLIFAYYHSTCGGRTANVEDVWDKPGFPYLRSIKDCDDNGRPYCAESWSYSWEESWPIERISNIVSRYSRETFPQNAASGTVRDIVIDDRYACGRTKTCRVKTTDGTFTYGGDKLRFVLRRNIAGFPVLRSAIVTDVSKNGGTIVVKGRGYGHGIGMCQFGAIGRARAGQSFEQILKAYYTGIEIRKMATR